MWIPDWELTRHLALGLMLGVAVWQDLSRRIIPNPVVMVGSLAALLLSLPPAGAGMPWSLLGGMVAFLSFLSLYLLRWIGAGDVKLAGAAGLYFDPTQALEISLSILMAGGVVAALWGLRTRASSGHGQRIPYALAIASGIGLHALLVTKP